MYFFCISLNVKPVSVVKLEMQTPSTSDRSAPKHRTYRARCRQIGHNLASVTRSPPTTRKSSHVCKTLAPAWLCGSWNVHKYLYTTLKQTLQTVRMREHYSTNWFCKAKASAPFGKPRNRRKVAKYWSVPRSSIESAVKWVEQRVLECEARSKTSASSSFIGQRFGEPPLGPVPVLLRWPSLSDGVPPPHILER